MESQHTAKFDVTAAHAGPASHYGGSQRNTESNRAPSEGLCEYRPEPKRRLSTVQGEPGFDRQRCRSQRDKEDSARSGTPPMKDIVEGKPDNHQNAVSGYADQILFSIGIPVIIRDSR